MSRSSGSGEREKKRGYRAKAINNGRNYVIARSLPELERSTRTFAEEEEKKKERKIGLPPLGGGGIISVVEMSLLREPITKAIIRRFPLRKGEGRARRREDGAERRSRTK